jgi:hypothetical protein
VAGADRCGKRGPLSATVFFLMEASASSEMSCPRVRRTRCSPAAPTGQALATKI